MSEIKHTPGPWEVEISDEGRVWVKDSTTVEGIIICDIPGDMETIEGEELMNARLIAAAPTLLSHLEFALKLLYGLPYGATAQIQAMRDTIEKVKGESE